MPSVGASEKMRGRCLKGMALLDVYGADSEVRVGGFTYQE